MPSHVAYGWEISGSGLVGCVPCPVMSTTLTTTMTCRPVLDQIVFASHQAPSHQDGYLLASLPPASWSMKRLPCPQQPPLPDPRHHPVPYVASPHIESARSTPALRHTRRSRSHTLPQGPASGPTLPWRRQQQRFDTASSTTKLHALDQARRPSAAGNYLADQTACRQRLSNKSTTFFIPHFLPQFDFESLLPPRPARSGSSRLLVAAAVADRRCLQKLRIEILISSRDSVGHRGRSTVVTDRDPRRSAIHDRPSPPRAFPRPADGIPLAPRTGRILGRAAREPCHRPDATTSPSPSRSTALSAVSSRRGSPRKSAGGRRGRNDDILDPALSLPPQDSRRVLRACRTRPPGSSWSRSRRWCAATGPAA